MALAGSILVCVDVDTCTVGPRDGCVAAAGRLCGDGCVAAAYGNACNAHPILIVCRGITQRIDMPGLWPAALHDRGVGTHWIVVLLCGPPTSLALLSMC